MRRHAVTLTLVALAVVGLVVVFFVDKGSVSTQEASDRKQNLFPAWRGDDVTDVVIASGGSVTRVSRDAAADGGTGAWSVTLDGTPYPADEQTVDDYLGRLHFAVHERRIPDASVDRAAFQLGAPRTTISVTMGSLAYRLAIGGPAATPEGAAYAEVGPAVYVITAQLLQALEVPPERFRSKTFLPYFSVDLRALSLDGEGGARHLARAPWGGARGSGWRFDDGADKGRRVSALAFDRVLTALGLMQADAYLTDAEADRLATHAVTLTLLPADAAKPRGVIELGGPCPGKDTSIVAIRREPTRASACVPSGVLEALSVPLVDLVDRRLLGAALDEVTEVKLAAGDRTLDLARAATGWHLRAPSDREVPADAGRDFMEALLAVTADAFESGDPADLGFAHPRATVRLISAIPTPRSGDAGDAERTEVLELGAEKGEIAYVRRLEDGAVLSIPKDRAADLLPGDLALRPRKVVNEPLKRFRTLRVERGTEVQELEREPAGGWRLVRPKGEGLAADSGLASDLAGLVGDLTAERWVADKDGGAFGLAAPHVVIEAEVGDDPADTDPDASPPPRRKLRITLGAPTTHGSFARLDGDPAVFIAPALLETVAGRYLLDRAALMVDPAKVTRVTLSAGKRKLEIVRAGEALLVLGAAANDPSAARRAAAVRDGISDLVAEGVASLGKPEAHQGLDKPQLELLIQRGTEGQPVRIRIGSGDSWRGTNVYYARRDGVDATYAVAQGKVRALLDAM